MTADERERDLSSVIQGDWCIGCGACTGVDPTIRLELSSDRGSYAPSHAGDVAAAAVCPAVSADISELSDALFPSAPRTAHGAIERVWLAQSVDRAENLAASSGGVIRPLLRELLEGDRVDGVVALTEVAGLEYRQKLYTDIEDLADLPGSIYHVVEHSDLYPILETFEGRLAVVGIPCQLEGLQLFLRSDAGRHLANRVVLTIGLFCGWQYTTHSIAALERYLRFKGRAITSVKYRGGGPVGKLRFSLDDGTERTLNRRVDYAAQVAFDRSFNLPRCHVCVNHSNFLADIAVGDAWLPETAFSKTGVSILIARSGRAVRAVEQLERHGVIRTVETDPSVVERSQGRVVAYGDLAYGLASALSGQGIFVPKVRAPNEGAARPTSAAEALAQWSSIERKRALQRQGRYWYLWIRKGTIELPALLRRVARSRLIRRYLRAIVARTAGDEAEGGEVLDGFA